MYCIDIFIFFVFALGAQKKITILYIQEQEGSHRGQAHEREEYASGSRIHLGHPCGVEKAILGGDQYVKEIVKRFQIGAFLSSVSMFALVSLPRKNQGY